MVAPGVTVNASGRAGLTSSVSNPAGRAFMVGICERGPVAAATKILSIAQFESVYGTRQSYGGSLYDAVRSYFEEGGPECWVGRVVGTTPVLGSYTFLDRAGSPLATFKVSALNPGAWSSEITVAIVAGSPGFGVVVYRNGVVVETWANQVDIPTAVASINGTSGAAGSLYIKATDMASGTTAPNNLPAIHAAQALASGADDRGTITATTVTNALALFPAGLGVGAVMTPGYTADLVGTALIAHAVATGRIALLSGAIDARQSELTALAATIVSGSNSQYAGLFAPWVTIPDGSSIRTVDPVGAVAGRRAKTINDNGFWSIPAGEQGGKFQFVTGTAWTVDETTNGVLAAAGVSGIVTYPTGPQLFGWFALEPDGSGNMQLLSNQDSLNSLTGGIQDLLHKYIWRTVDGSGALFGEIRGDLEGFLDPLAQAGCFYARIDPNDDTAELDPGYSVTVDDTLNPSQQLANNIVKAAVGVRFSPALVSLQVNVYESGLTASV